MTKINMFVNLSDFKYSAWLHLKPSKFIGFIGILLVLLFSYLFVFGIVGFLTGQTGHISLTFLIGFIFLYLVLFAWLYMRKVTKIYSQSKFMHGPIELLYDENAFSCKSDSMECRFLYKDIVKVKSDSRMMIAYVNDVQYSIFPKSSDDNSLAANYIENQCKLHKKA